MPETLTYSVSLSRLPSTTVYQEDFECWSLVSSSSLSDFSFPRKPCSKGSEMSEAPSSPLLPACNVLVLSSQHVMQCQHRIHLVRDYVWCRTGSTPDIPSLPEPTFNLQQYSHPDVRIPRSPSGSPWHRRLLTTSTAKEYLCSFPLSVANGFARS